MWRPSRASHAAITRFTVASAPSPLRPSVFGVVVLTGRPHLSNNVADDDFHVGTPRGHPPVRTFLGVPLLFGSDVLGLQGVAIARAAPRRRAPAHRARAARA